MSGCRAVVVAWLPINTLTLIATVVDTLLAPGAVELRIRQLRPACPRVLHSFTPMEAPALRCSAALGMPGVGTAKPLLPNPVNPVVLALCPSILSVALGVAARRRGGVCVAVVHDIQSGLAEKLGMVGGGHMVRLMRAAERTILNRTDLVAVLSAEMKDQLRGIGITVPIEVIPLWVDTDHIQAAPAVTRSSVKVLYSGNLGRKQGLGQVVALARELADRRLDIEIVLRGNGNQASELLDQIKSLGLTNIQLAELQPNEALGTALAAGDIHLVPQRPDAAAFAVPSKVFNIMAVGRPFVATALPDSVLWNLQRQSGAFLCVPPDDAPSFAEAVIRLADDSRLRQELGRRGREFVEANYAKPRILGHLVDRLDAVAAAK